MRRILVLSLLSLSLVAAARADEEALVGHWYGAMSLPGGQVLHMAVEVDERSDGSLGADLISIDQGADGISSSQIEVDGAAVRLEFRPPAVAVVGELSADGQHLDARFIQGTFETALPLARVEVIPGFIPRWQNPTRPYPYDDQAVRFAGGAPQITLEGTLSLPPTPGPHPAVVLVTGSGPQGRDELIAYHRPFLVLADQLTRHGIAVLRYDDRGVGASTGTFSEATTADLAADARAAWMHLRSRSEIDPQRIWIVGHSEGGMIAPMVAAEEPEVAGIVLLAGPGIPIIDLMEMQQRGFARAGGASESHADLLARLYRAIYETLNAETDRITIFNTIQAVYDGLSDEEAAQLGWSRSVINGVIESHMTPWWRYFLAFDPVDYLTRVSVPLLAVNGDADLNVTAVENLAGIEAAAALAGNRDVTTVQYPGLNHMLNRTETAAPGDSVGLGETINPAVLERVTRWIQVRAGIGATVIAESLEGQPTRISLSTNYPNPFNGRTLIDFDISTEDMTELAVYDLAGQRISVLAQGRLPPGHFQVTWDGIDQQGREAATGVYLLELRSGSRVKHQVLTLLR